MKFKITLIVNFILAITFCQSGINIERVETNYEILQLNSKFFNEERTVKISLPDGFDNKKKYPVIYVLDGSSLFYITSNYVSHLSKQTRDEAIDYGTDAIPQSIVVGVFHNDRNYETQPNFSSILHTDETKYNEGSEKLKKFLFKELVPHINTNFATSGYNVIIGHSNTGHFVSCLPFQEHNPFNGIIALSVSGDSENLKTKLNAFFKSNKEYHFFMGYGTKDFGYNDLAKYLEKQDFSNHFKTSSFNANHSELPALALVDGIKHLFYNYRNINDFVMTSKKAEFDLMAYLSHYETKNKTAYGIETKIKEDDFLSLLELSIRSKNKKALKQILTYDREVNGFETQTHMLFIYHKQIGDLEKAALYANKMLSSTDSFENRILKANLDHYYTFFTKDLKDFQRGVDFFTTARTRFEDSKLEFSYFTAKITIENNIKQSIGKVNLDYCIKNYRTNRYFRRTDLERLNKLRIR